MNSGVQRQESVLYLIFFLHLAAYFRNQISSTRPVFSWRILREWKPDKLQLFGEGYEAELAEETAIVCNGVGLIIMGLR